MLLVIVLLLVFVIITVIMLISDSYNALHLASRRLRRFRLGTPRPRQVRPTGWPAADQSVVAVASQEQPRSAEQPGRRWQLARLRGPNLDEVPEGRRRVGQLLTKRPSGSPNPGWGEPPRSLRPFWAM